MFKIEIYESKRQREVLCIWRMHLFTIIFERYSERGS